MTKSALTFFLRFDIHPAKCRRHLFVCLSAVLLSCIAIDEPAAQESGSAVAESVRQAILPSPGAPEFRTPHSSDVLSYWYGASYHTPFVANPQTGKAADIQRNAIEFTHSSETHTLTTFADVTVSRSNMAEPAASGGVGATELYAILRQGASLRALTGTNRVGVRPLRDIILEAGANLETKNSSYASGERTLYVGPKLQLAIARGFVNVGLHFRKEWNHEGVLGKSEDYSPDFNLEPAWMLPFSLGKAHLAYSGFADYNTAKGRDSFGNSTSGEFLLRNTLGVDVGSLFFGRAQMVDLNGGFWYWHNEYGKPAGDLGSKQMTPIVGLTFHLDGGRPIRNN